MKKQYELSQEEFAVKEIEGLYNTMISGGEDRHGRHKIVTVLMNLQKQDGSWCVIDTRECDSDIRVAYLYEPTYYATAAMMYADLRDTYDIDSMEKKVLLKGLEVALERQLSGHGYSSTEQKLKALNVYKKAGLYEWMKKNEACATEFCEMIKTIIDRMQADLNTGNTISDWQKDFKTEYEKEVTEYIEAMQEEVWYVAYGSNISYDRFIQYINDCTDKTLPAENKPYILPYNIYFAYKSSRWNRKGVVFLDETKPGMAYGRAYKIKMSQFLEIRRNEGSVYSKKICLGQMDNVPVYTFTSPMLRTDIMEPSREYMDVISKGLKEVYPEMSEGFISVYLYTRGVLQQDDLAVLSYIRRSAHGVSIGEMTQSGVPVTRVKATIKRLAALELVKQDGRNIAAGYEALEPEAVYYTKKEKRELIDMMILFSISR